MDTAHDSALGAEAGKHDVAAGYHWVLGAIVDGTWLSLPTAAEILQLERLIGAFLAGFISILSLAVALYRFAYWRAKAKREQLALDRERA